MIPKLVDTLKAPGFRAQIIKLLYHLSLEDKAKATFTYTDCIPLVYQLIIHCPEPIVGKELIACQIDAHALHSCLKLAHGILQSSNEQKRGQYVALPKSAMYMKAIATLYTPRLICVHVGQQEQILSIDSLRG